MSTGLPILRHLRPRAFWRTIVHSAGSSSTVVRPEPYAPPVSMFARAVEVAKPAAVPPLPKAPVKTSLEKQLFPSSSPNPTTDQGIQRFLQNSQKSSNSATGPARNFMFARDPSQTEALKNRSPNNDCPRPHTSAKGKAFASLYNSSKSFVDVVEGTSQPTLAHSNSGFAAGVYIDPDDFDDYETLDLDYVTPSALPVLPRSSASAARREMPPPASNRSTISWSQSSPSHFLPPRQQSHESQKAGKRESPEDESSPLPVAKKRTMPWQKKAPAHIEDEELFEHENPTHTATPASKAKAASFWNATPNAIQAQKKQLKNQQRRPNAAADTTEFNEIRESIGAHAPAKSAISLSNEQRHVKTLVVDKNQSVFFTGPAGTGKSVLMRSIIQDLKKKYAKDPERVAVTASTGLAACNIGGMTLHSFAGIGLGKEDAQALVKKIRRNPKAKNRWLRTKALIIDEISMVDGELFDKLSQIGRIIRNNGRPWGGIQLVITGDFFQLPPVPDNFKDGNKQRDIRFAFEAATWNTSLDHTIGLTEVFRQRDPVFANMLNEMRLGRISEQTVQNFKALSRVVQFDDGLEVTELFPTRNEVESSNERRLKALPGKSFRYEAMDTGDPAMRDKLLQNMMAPKTLELKKGAQVMLIKNMDDTLVNGSLGTVTGFMSESKFEVMGTTGDAGSDAEDDSKFKKRMKAFSKELESSATAGHDTREFPLVKFHAVDGTERILLCIPEDWKVELPTGEVQASRKQLPLILAWALSIHKAQGQTLERVKVDLGRVFEKGQAYVALSRATTQEGLQVLRFQKDKVMAHPRVVGFYDKLYSVETAVKKKTAPSITNFAYKPQGRYEVIDLDDEEEALAAYG